MNPAWAQVILATVVAWIGAFGATLLRHAGARVMRRLVYLALFVFALIAIFDILPESKRDLSWPVFAGSVGLGYLVFWIIGKYITPICPACAMRHFEEGHRHTHGKASVVLTAVLAIHCFLDGLGISAATTIGSAFGLRVFGAIAVHKLPEGFALALILTANSRSTTNAMLAACAVEATTLAGAVVGVVWAHPSEFWLAVVLAHIGGTFLYLSVSGLQDAISARTPDVVAAGSYTP